jgi:hypothetical protein
MSIHGTRLFAIAYVCPRIHAHRVGDLKVCLMRAQAFSDRRGVKGHCHLSRVEPFGGEEPFSRPVQRGLLLGSRRCLHRDRLAPNLVVNGSLQRTEMFGYPHPRLGRAPAI